MCETVVDDRAKRRKADSTCDEQEVLALELVLDREMIAIGASDQNLVSLVKSMKISGELSAFLDGEFVVILDGR